MLGGLGLGDLLGLPPLALEHLLLASLQLGDLLVNALSLREPIRAGHVCQTPYRVRHSGTVRPA
jgi:hypothetical protein